MAFTIHKKNILFYYFTIAAIGGLLFYLYLNSLVVESSKKKVNQSQVVLHKNNEILFDIINIETGVRGYMLTDDLPFLESYYQTQQNIYRNLVQLIVLTKGNLKQQTRIKNLKIAIDTQIAIVQSLIQIQMNGRGDKELEMHYLFQSKIVMDAIRRESKNINLEESKALNQRIKANASSIETSYRILFVLFLVLLFFVFLTYFLIKNQLKLNAQLEQFIRSDFFDYLIEDQNGEKQKTGKQLKIADKAIRFQNKKTAKKEDLTKENETDTNSSKLAALYSFSLIEASRDPLFTISKEGIITDVNQASVNATDVSKKDLIGSVFIKYFTEPEKAKKGYEEVFSKGFVVDYPLVIKDHKLTDVLFNGAVYKDENNEVIGAVVVARDVTEQKNAEKKLLQSLKEVTDYKLALDASTIVDITDKKGTILFVNENYLKISKYSFNELIGGSHKMVNSNYHDAEFMNNLWNTISKGKIWQNEIRNKDKSGAYYWLNMTIVPFLDEQGIPYQYVAISIDITNQKILEKELIEAKVFAELATSIAEESKNTAETETTKAIEAVKSKQQFLSNMSHEIRTPMNAIIGFTKVVLKTELTAKQKEYLTAIKMSGDALIVLINDILDLAKVDAGKMTFEKTPFKLSLSIKAMLHLFEPKIQEKNLELITHYDKNIPDVLIGDPVRLHQIILNLVSNAVKFTHQGRITVSVILVSENEKEVVIKFAVSDTGIGIKEIKIEQIFENFQQATSGTSRIFGGTGLGLAIVKQLVNAQGGTIDVESKFGKGSTFSFNLKFKKTVVHTVLEPEILELNTDIKDIKILVVEDMELNQLLMKTVLDDFGFECEIAANGRIAIDKLKNQECKKPFDIILMDLQMPEMNGFEATTYIRETMKYTIPIVALTADVTTVDVAKCKAVGMNDYISKPVDERLLYSKLVGLIKKPVLIMEHLIDGKKDTHTIKYLDMTYLFKLTKSNPLLMTELINSYLKQTPTLIKTMKQSFHEKDWKLLNATIHKMLPSFSIMGMHTDVTEIAQKIQNYATEIERSKELEDLVLELEKVCMQTCKELEFELINLK